MSTVAEIQQAITGLSTAEQRQLARWFEEALEDAWDTQIEEDIKAARRHRSGEADITAGCVRSLWMKSLATAEFLAAFCRLASGCAGARAKHIDCGFAIRITIPFKKIGVSGQSEYLGVIAR